MEDISLPHSSSSSRNVVAIVMHIPKRSIAATRLQKMNGDKFFPTPPLFFHSSPLSLVVVTVKNKVFFAKKTYMVKQLYQNTQTLGSFAAAPFFAAYSYIRVLVPSLLASIFGAICFISSSKS